MQNYKYTNISGKLKVEYIRWTFAQNQKMTYSSVLHSHKVLMKLCPCERYRQMNSVL